MKKVMLLIVVLMCLLGMPLMAQQRTVIDLTAGEMWGVYSEDEKLAFVIGYMMAMAMTMEFADGMVEEELIEGVGLMVLYRWLLYDIQVGYLVEQIDYVANKHRAWDYPLSDVILMAAGVNPEYLMQDYEEEIVPQPNNSSM